MEKNNLEEEFSWGFDAAYVLFLCVFGRAADQFLALNLQFVHRDQALDLGCGEGRNALYLAQEGFEVAGVDKSREGPKKVRCLAEEYGLTSKVKIVPGNFRGTDLGARDRYHDGQELWGIANHFFECGLISCLLFSVYSWVT